MKLRLAAICDGARERADGKLDLDGVFNELSAPGFPALQERLTVVFILEWDADEEGRQPLRADLVDQQDRRVLTIQGHTDVPARSTAEAAAQTRLIMPIERVVFPESGRYRFQLLVGGTITDACSIFVGHLPAGGQPR